MVARMNNAGLRAQALALADQWDHLADEREKLLAMHTKQTGSL